MILKMFAIRDRATDMFGNPMFLMSDGQAIRTFTDEVNRVDEQSSIFKHPDDYDLYYLGTYETSLGIFESVPPVQVAIGKMVKIRS